MQGYRLSMLKVVRVLFQLLCPLPLPVVLPQHHCAHRPESPSSSTSPSLPSIDWLKSTSVHRYHLNCLHPSPPRSFTAWWNQTRGSLVLQIPDESLETEFVITALASRGSAEDFLLHEPLHDAEYNVFQFKLAPLLTLTFSTHSLKSGYCLTEQFHRKHTKPAHGVAGCERSLPHVLSNGIVE